MSSHSEIGPGDAGSHQDDVMRSLGSTLSALQQSIVDLTAQLQEMKQPPRAVTEEEVPSNSTFPWAETLEERYPVKDPATYTEFEKKYPPDRFGEEATDTARVWKLYRDRATELDQDKIDSWNKTLDILLIFAGLFSAVASAFLVESYQLLQQDYSQYLALAFFAAQTNTTIPNPADFVAPTAAVWINALWFTSLLLALTVALLAILVKQWLGEYSSRMRAHVASPRSWVWRHLTYSAGLEKWHVDAFLSTLPVLLHMAQFLFFAGLAIFLWNVNLAIAIVIASGTAVVTIFYAFATMAPLVYGDCPSATPLLRQLHAGFNLLKRRIRSSLVPLTVLPGMEPAASGYFWKNLRAIRTAIYRHLPQISFASFEEPRLIRDTARLDLNALCWMVNNLPAEVEVEVAVGCVGSLDIEKHLYAVQTEALAFAPLSYSCTRYLSALSRKGALVDDISVARCLRAMRFLGIQRDALEPRDFPADFQVSVSRWINTRSYDLYFLALDFTAYSHKYDDLDEPIIRWSGRNAPTISTMLPSTLRLLSIGGLRQSHDTLALIACAIHGVRNGSPFQESMRHALSETLDSFDPELQHTWWKKVPVWRPLDTFSDVLLRVLHLCSFHFQTTGERSELVNTTFYAALDGLARETSFLDLQELEVALSYVGTRRFLLHHWHDDATLAIGTLLSNSMLQLDQGADVHYWSAALNKIWQNWLLQCDDEDITGGMRKQSMFIVLALAERLNHFDVNKYTSFETALQDSFINILRCPSTPPPPVASSIGFLDRGPRSSWRMSVEIGRQTEFAWKFGEIAHVLSGSLLPSHL